MNKQREVIYGFRNEVIHATDVRDRLMDMMEEVVIEKVEEFTSDEPDVQEGKVRALADWVKLNCPVGVREQAILNAAESDTAERVKGSVFDGLSAAQFAACNFISEKVRKAYELKISYENPEALKEVERYTILSAIDRLWQEHLYEMDSLRYSLGLHAHRQHDPLIEYKAEAFKLFEDLMFNLKTAILPNILRTAARLHAVV